MKLAQVDSFNADIKLRESLAEVREIENELVLLTDNAVDFNALHEGCPMLFVVIEDIAKLSNRLERAIQQISEAK